MDANMIQSQIQKEMANFLAKKFSGILPDWFLDNFEKYVLELPQSEVPYRAQIVEEIIGKNINDLTNNEVGLITNIALAVPPKLISSNIKKYLAKKIVLEGIRTEWNKMNETEMERLRKKASSFAENSRARIIH